MTVISGDQKNSKGWSRKEALRLREDGYTDVHIMRLTGHRLPPRRS